MRHISKEWTVSTALAVGKNTSTNTKLVFRRIVTAHSGLMLKSITMTPEQDQQMIEITVRMKRDQAAACVALLKRIKNLGYRQLATSDKEADLMQQAGELIQAALDKVKR